MKDENEIKTIQIANEVLIPEVIKMIHEGHTVTLPLRGYSMRPFLEDGRDKALLKFIAAVDVGDAVLAEIAPRRYVLHRIVAFDGDEVILRGDGNLNTERCRITDIKATAIGFFRKGSDKADSTLGLKWRVYSWIWMRLLPIRRYLLFALHPHIPNRLKRKTTKK